MDVAEPHVAEHGQLLRDPGLVLERRKGVLHRELECVGDRQPPEAHLQRFAIVALPLAHIAGDVDVGEKMHLDLHQAVALTGLTTAPLDVEREAPRPIAT
jgi:hypothetical protein